MIRHVMILRLVLLVLCLGSAIAGAPRSVVAQPIPPQPQTSVSVSHLVTGAWKLTKVVRLEEVRFQLRVHQQATPQPISSVTLRIRQTRLEQDGEYHFLGVLYQSRMRPLGLSGGDLHFQKDLSLQDRRMVGKVFAEFVVRYGQAELVPNLLLTVKPVHGNIPGGNPGTDAYWGLRMTVRLPQRTYPRDALVLAQVSVQNLSGQTRTIQSGYCFKPPWIETLDAHGHVLPRLSFDGSGPPCPGIISTPIPPGGSIEQQQYVVLGGARLRVAATVGQLHISGRPLLLHLTAEAPPRLSIQDTGSAITAQLQPSGAASGPLHFGYRIDCTLSGQLIAAEGTHTWRTTTGSTLSVSRPSGCDPGARWAVHAVAGWLGQSVAHVDFVGRTPVPCDRGLVGRQPTLTDVPPGTLAAIGITLLPPQSTATVCQAQAIYRTRLPFGGSTPPRAVLAQVASSSDPPIDGRLAWVILTRSPDPNHPTNPPVLYLSFVDARTGVALDTVYAGGLHPPGPPIHMHTIPPPEAALMVLSTTHEAPPVGQSQARQVLARSQWQGTTVREVVLARVYNPNTPPLRDHLCWIFSVTPPGRGGVVKKGGFWLIYIDADSGKVLMAGGTVG